MGKIGRTLSKILSRDIPRDSQSYDFKNPSVPDLPKSDAALILPGDHIASLAINDLVANTMQPRMVFDDSKLEELAASIRSKGILQPIVYRKTDKGNEIIAGERRWRAAKMAGLETVPAIKKNVTDEEALELAIIENVQRNDLNPIEKARGYKTLIEKYNLSQQEVADRIGVNRTTIANIMRLLQLPLEIKEYVSRETISMGHARCLLTLNSEEQQILLAKRIIAEDLSVRQVESMVYGEKRGDVTRTPRTAAIKTPNIIDLEKKFCEALNTKVTIKNAKNNKGKIVIEYYSNGDFVRILERLNVKI